MSNYYVLYKPYGTVSQFSKEGDKPTLANLPFGFPKDVYPVGRLDSDSEGLLLLTNDTRVNSKLLDPERGHKRIYLAQVEGNVSDRDCEKLSRGISIKIDGKEYHTRPCTALVSAEPENLPPRNPPIRFRMNIPTSWIRLELTEGKNKQVRKMTAAVGFPTLRLVRYSIDEISLEGMSPGDVRELSRIDFYKKLHL